MKVALGWWPSGMSAAASARIKGTPGRRGQRQTVCKGDVAMSPLSAWVNFYVVMGTAAGSLVGLTFVVISLVAGRAGQAVRPGLSGGGLGAYNTPTVVHFAAVLLAGATLSAPWPTLAPVAILLGLGGLGGAAYVVVVARRLARWEVYVPVIEDWAFHAVLPLAAYAALVVAALLLRGSPTPALFVVGAALLLLVVVGIHNAWDLITAIVLRRDEEGDGGMGGSAGKQQ